MNPTSYLAISTFALAQQQHGEWEWYGTIKKPGWFCNYETSDSKEHTYALEIEDNGFLLDLDHGEEVYQITSLNQLVSLVYEMENR